ncbi:MAG: hypothetical protein L0Y35_07250 [Flammeovirgaceae bacterium]|nr:hypothetical protein [Flammeovirgaceae bacterium]
MKRIASILIPLVFAACSSNETQRLDDREYFPIRVGSTWTYSVSETTYSEFDNPVTNEYEIQWIVTDSLATQANELMYIVNRIKVLNELSEPENLESWAVRKGDLELVIQEGNQAYVKLIFPISAGSGWNANLYNSDGEDEVRIESAGTPYSTLLAKYSACTFINQNDEVNAVYEDVRSEVFAYGVGLIEKHSRVIELCTNFSGCQQPIVAGSEITMTLKEYAL